MKPIGAKRTMEDYADMLNLPHHTSGRHPRMSPLARAAQFAPFAALTGYGEMIAESARLVDSKAGLSEEQQAEINEQLGQLMPLLPEEPAIRVVYFVQDPLKDGGRYETAEGSVRRIDPIRQTVTLKTGLVIRMDDIRAIERIRGD